MSSCLLGDRVRYNGTDMQLDKRILERMAERYQIISFCPELEGGLQIPRDPAEIQGGTGCEVLCGKAVVHTVNGDDVSREFVSGAKKLLALCKKMNIQLAILTENSPSCGSKHIYSGMFTGTKKNGDGVAAALLKMNNINVLNQHEVVGILDCNL